MSSPFAAPAQASGIQWKDFLGNLLLIEPKAFEQGISTSNGIKDAVRADVTVIDADEAPEVYADTLIFPGVLISQTRSLVGEKVLGRLSQGVAKSGQNPPWRLEDATEDDITLGTRYLESRTPPKPASPFASANTQEQKQPPF